MIFKRKKTKTKTHLEEAVKKIEKEQDELINYLNS